MDKEEKIKKRLQAEEDFAKAAEELRKVIIRDFKIDELAQKLTNAVQTFSEIKKKD